MTPHESALPLNWVSSEYMLRWLGMLPEVTIGAFGEARAVCTPSVPDLDFLNTVHRLRPEDSEQVPLIAEFYRAAGVQPWLELMPAPNFERLATELSAAGASAAGLAVSPGFGGLIRTIWGVRSSLTMPCHI